jgi:hypothetical protein
MRLRSAGTAIRQRSASAWLDLNAGTHSPSLAFDGSRAVQPHRSRGFVVAIPGWRGFDSRRSPLLPSGSRRNFSPSPAPSAGLSRGPWGVARAPLRRPTVRAVLTVGRWRWRRDRHGLDIRHGKNGDDGAGRRHVPERRLGVRIDAVRVCLAGDEFPEGTGAVVDPAGCALVVEVDLGSRPERKRRFGRPVGANDPVVVEVRAGVFVPDQL